MGTDIHPTRFFPLDAPSGLAAGYVTHMCQCALRKISECFELNSVLTFPFVLKSHSQKKLYPLLTEPAVRFRQLEQTDESHRVQKSLV